MFCPYCGKQNILTVMRKPNAEELLTLLMSLKCCVDEDGNSLL